MMGTCSDVIAYFFLLLDYRTDSMLRISRSILLDRLNTFLSQQNLALASESPTFQAII